MEINEIDATSFVDARSGEIKLLETKISQSTKKTQLFQRLPFHKRRRTKSKDTRKTPNKHKRKNKRKTKSYDFPYLKTHKWFAKRFKMIKMFDSAVPYERTIKSDKFIYKSSSRGFIYDESYKNIKFADFNEIKNTRFYDLIVNNKKQKLHSTIENMIENCCYNIETLINDHVYFFDVFKTKNKIYIVYLPNIDFEGLLGSNIFFSACFSCLTYYKDIKISESGIYDKFEKQNNDNDCFIDEFFDNKYEKKYLYVKYTDESFETGKIFITRSYTMIVWQFLYVSGCIPISIKEMLRLGTENLKLIFPFDYVNSHYYTDYEKCIVQPIKDKYDRIPKSKKPNYEKMKIENPFFMPQTTKIVCTSYFVAAKGSIKRMAMIYNESFQIIGYVIRGSFCFTIGKNRGVCILFEDTKGKKYAQNINENIKYDIQLE
ncbi:Ribonucleases P/MRP protein subunit pop1 [Binucleata daphniae]